MTLLEQGGQPTTIDEYTEWNARELARQAVSRRSVLKAVMAGAGGYAAAQFGLAERRLRRRRRDARHGRDGDLGAAPVLRAGPRRPPDNAMAVTAQLVSKTGMLPSKLRCFVDVGTEPGHYGERYEAEIVHLVGQYAIPGGPVGSQFYAKAVLDGLRADKVYHYRLRLSDGATSGTAYFTTAPKPAKGRRNHRSEVPEPFTFTAFADVGTNNAPTDPKYAWGQDPDVGHERRRHLAGGIFDNNYYKPADPVAGTSGRDPHPAATQTNLMASQRPVFTLLAGDICYADPGGSGLPGRRLPHPARDVGAGHEPLQPVRLGRLPQPDREPGGLHAVDVRDRQPRHGAPVREHRAAGRQPDPRLRRAPGPARPAGQRAARAARRSTSSSTATSR